MVPLWLFTCFSFEKFCKLAKKKPRNKIHLFYLLFKILFTNLFVFCYEVRWWIQTKNLFTHSIKIFVYWTFLLKTNWICIRNLNKNVCVGVCLCVSLQHEIKDVTANECFAAFWIESGKTDSEADFICAAATLVGSDNI